MALLDAFVCESHPCLQGGWRGWLFHLLSDGFCPLDSSSSSLISAELERGDKL